MIPEEKLEFETKFRIGIHSVISEMIQKVKAKKMLKCIAVALGQTSYMGVEMPDFKEAVEAWKILLYVCGNWDKVLNSSEKYYETVKRRVECQETSRT